VEHAAVDEQNAELRAQIERLVSERDELRRVYLDLLERYQKLERGLLGQKAERLPQSEAQLSLGILSALLTERERLAAADDETTTTVQEHVRKAPSGRKPLPENLPRVEIVVLPPEVEREGTDAFERIGEEVSEVIERRPASIVVARVVRPKFVRRVREDATGVLCAPPPALPIPRGLAGPGMLADTIVRRWQDHLPTHRLESIYAREGLELARSTVCGWHEQLAALAAPLVRAMWSESLLQPYLCTDATGVLVQAKEKCKNAHFWVVLAPGLHVLFGYSRKHDKRAVDRMLGGYKGYLVADAHTVYDHLYVLGDVTEVGCWAHVRRYFFKSLSTDPERAREGLALIGHLFHIERSIADAPRKKREGVRRDRSATVVRKFFEWCDLQAGVVLDETPISRAIGYARNQRGALERFLDDGRLPIHNNGSELALRRQAVGRKNWLFVGSDDGGETNATFVTLLASCQLHGIEPWAYLRDLFCLLPDWPAPRVLELAPAHWRKTLEQHETQERLAANRFRAITLGESADHRPSE
jgi:transposase